MRAFKPIDNRALTNSSALTHGHFTSLHAAQPAGGDVPVGRLRQMDAVPEHALRRVLARDRSRVAAEDRLVVVEPPGASTAEREHVFKPCNHKFNQSLVMLTAD
jgi:hypothetical protein